jgi:glyoxylase-like metal-dependent hydrolase (beta-lactamase superfamily II)
MLKKNEESRLSFPHEQPPEPGMLIELAPGILWTRIPLPFRLNHVNIYLIEDGDGWAVLDTGIGNSATKDIWESLVSGPLAGRRLTRLIVTHYHPDHIGLAGWLCERYGLPLFTTQTSYLGCQVISLSPGALDARPYRDFYARHGMAPETVDLVSSQGHNYLRMVTPLPLSFTRVVDGDTLRIGGREFRALTGDGHAPEQLMLYCPSANVLLAADQVIARISPNISVWAVDPDGDPLGLYLRSLKRIKASIPAGTLVLPGHQLPFHGLHERCEELAAHHADRCAVIAEACAAKPHSVADLVPVLFTRELDPHQLSFAFSEVHAHVNFMLRRGELRHAASEDGNSRVEAA